LRNKISDSFLARLLQASLIILFAQSLVGCATFKQESFLETPEANKAALVDSDEASIATVFLIRKKLAWQAAQIMPVPPIFFALNNRMLAAMPLGTFVKLKLQPGNHCITGMFVVGDAIIAPKIASELTLNLKVESGNKYYVIYDQSFLRARL